MKFALFVPKAMKTESNQTHLTRMLSESERSEDDDELETSDLEPSSSKDGDPSSSDGDAADRSIARIEDRLVRYSKGLVLMVIFAVAVGMGFITYAFVKGQQDSAYKNHFHEASSELVVVSQARAREIYDNLEAFSATLTSFAHMEGATWPFVVIPDFQVHGMVSNQITGASSLTVVPIVRHEDRAEWESFSVNASREWLSEAHAFDKEVNPSLYVEERFNGTPTGTPDYLRWNETGVIQPFIWTHNGSAPIPAEFAEVYYPAWQGAPAPDYAPFNNIDLTHYEFFARVIQGMLETDRPVITEVTSAVQLGQSYELRFDPEDLQEPHSYLFQPIYDTLKTDRKAVAILMAFFKWGRFFENVLPAHEPNILVVMYGTCNQTFSYQLEDGNPIFLGEDDFHDPAYDDFGVDFDIAPFAELPETSERKYCQYNARIFPTGDFEDKHITNDPYYYATAVIACFIVTTLVFVVYDYLVNQRQQRVSEQAAKTTKIVNSMFPANVRERLLEGGETEQNKKKAGWSDATKTVFNARSSKLDDSKANTSEAIFGSKPIADFFPDTTIMFADMVGFTAWSSMRDPTQVFTLLETIYHSFDSIANRRRVFKVETIGDCYVAVSGLPNKRKDHAIVMAKFARECLESMNLQVQHLETSLGPDTAALAMRVGLHSGPVTAGVLRGEKGRFQLFGDTMNTASRMESTGVRGKIQVSRETANLLIAAGKGLWLTERNQKVQVKGKGQLKTFWLCIAEGSLGTSSQNSSGAPSMSNSSLPPMIESQKKTYRRKETKKAVINDRTQRLVQWNCDILARHLKEIIAWRSPSRTARNPVSSENTFRPHSGGNTLDEVQDVLSLPRVNQKDSKKLIDPNSFVLSEQVKVQLNDFVSKIAASYPVENPFHNFEHASHVTMSVTKLMSRIVQPHTLSIPESFGTMPGNTFTMTFSDPLIQFSCVLSALMHDAEHPGVGNPVLVEENDPMAIQYNGKSVAEQNSVDVCWHLLMQPEYKDLQAAIFAHDAEELKRFRSLIVQCVLSTDIQDADLGALRRARWEKAFALDGSTRDTDDKDVAINRKATIVLEHLMQASDVAHTMQHWHVFRKWNECLFREVYFSYLDGRIKNDPSKGWYQGELQFFDKYIIPLAKKLETCGVFGVSSTEYLGYAEENRMEWEEKGQAIVQEYVSAANAIREELEKKTEPEQDPAEEYFQDEHSTDFSYDVPALEDFEEGVTACIWV